jgi:hypothetical protein
MPAMSLSNGGSDWEQKKLASKSWNKFAGHKVFSNRHCRHQVSAMGDTIFTPPLLAVNSL